MHGIEMDLNCSADTLWAIVLGIFSKVLPLFEVLAVVLFFYNIALRHSGQTAAGLDSDVRAFGYFLHSQLSPYLCGYSLSVFRSLFTLQMLAVCPHLLLRFWNLKIPHCLPPAKSVSDGQNERERESLWGHSCRLVIVLVLRELMWPVEAAALWCRNGSSALCRGTSAVTFSLTRENSRVCGIRALIHDRVSSGQSSGPETNI